jgi:hypothetical protein
MYPIGALLRIDKYKNKGFDISKREMIKLALHCTTHHVTSIDQLEEEVGTMYGVDLSTHMPKTKETFSISNVIHELENIPEDQVFDMPPKYQGCFDDSEEGWREVFPNGFRWVRVKDKYYAMDILNEFCGQSKTKDELEEHDNIEEMQYPMKVYKWVVEEEHKNKPPTYRSVFRSSFKYVIGEKFKENTGHGVYTGLKSKMEDSYIGNGYDRVMIEVLVKKEDDIIKFDIERKGEILIKAGEVTKIVKRGGR